MCRKMGVSPLTVLLATLALFTAATPLWTLAQELPAPGPELQIFIDMRYYSVYGTLPPASPSPTPTPSPTPAQKPPPVDQDSSTRMCCYLEPERYPVSPSCALALQLAGVSLYPNYDSERGIVGCVDIPELFTVTLACDGSFIHIGQCYSF